MAEIGRVDYHIHYYMDICAHKEMTLDNIEAEAARLGLEEICILKHYSDRLPNGKKEWVHWKQVVPEQFEDFLKDVRSFRSQNGIRILAGVESELLNEEGEINIGGAAMDAVDSVSLSVHWIPALKALSADPVLYPGDIGRISAEAADAWRRMVAKTGAEEIVKGLVNCYINAIARNPKVRMLAHMNDGLNTLRSYEIPVEDLGGQKLAKLMEPLFTVCVQKKVLWEIAESPVKCEAVLERADEFGVRFSATVDAHFLHAEGWSHLYDHYDIENYIDHLKLTKGVITL